MKRVIVCDSGLGGLNIASNFFTAGGHGRTPCELIYFNAYPSQKCGFNDLPSLRKQEEVFRDAFEGMKKFSPDLCLIACNTLSIVYERLRQWYDPGFDVCGIVECAADNMLEVMQKNPESSLLILGTRSTIESGAYARKLTGSGIAADRIKGIGCPGLATLLESDPDAAEVRERIAGYAGEAEKLFDKPPQKLFCALCCTHFGFASEIWEREFAGKFPGFAGLINPNDLLGNGFTASSFSYHSRIDFFPGGRENMSRYFEKISPQIANALKNAAADPELFDSPVTDKRK